MLGEQISRSRKHAKSAITKLKEAIESFQDVYESEDSIYNAPVPVKELHEFLALETPEPTV